MKDALLETYETGIREILTNPDLTSDQKIEIITDKLNALDYSLDLQTNMRIILLVEATKAIPGGFQFKPSKKLNC